MNHGSSRSAANRASRKGTPADKEPHQSRPLGLIGLSDQEIFDLCKQSLSGKTLELVIGCDGQSDPSQVGQRSEHQENQRIKAHAIHSLSSALSCCLDRDIVLAEAFEKILKERIALASGALPIEFAIKHSFPREKVADLFACAMSSDPTNLVGPDGYYIRAAQRAGLSDTWVKIARELISQTQDRECAKSLIKAWPLLREALPKASLTQIEHTIDRIAPSLWLQEARSYMDSDPSLFCRKIDNLHRQGGNLLLLVGNLGTISEIHEDVRSAIQSECSAFIRLNPSGFRNCIRDFTRILGEAYILETLRSELLFFPSNALIAETAILLQKYKWAKPLASRVADLLATRDDCLVTILECGGNIEQIPGLRDTKALLDRVLRFEGPIDWSAILRRNDSFIKVALRSGERILALARRVAHLKNHEAIGEIFDAISEKVGAEIGTRLQRETHAQLVGIESADPRIRSSIAILSLREKLHDHSTPPDIGGLSRDEISLLQTVIENRIISQATFRIDSIDQYRGLLEHSRAEVSRIAGLKMSRLANLVIAEHLPKDLSSFIELHPIAARLPTSAFQASQEVQRASSWSELTQETRELIVWCFIFNSASLNQKVQQGIVNELPNDARATLDTLTLCAELGILEGTSFTDLVDLKQRCAELLRGWICSAGSVDSEEHVEWLMRLSLAHLKSIARVLDHTQRTPLGFSALVIPSLYREAARTQASVGWGNPNVYSTTVNCIPNNSWNTSTIRRLVEQARNELAWHPSTNAIHELLAEATQEIRKLDREKREILASTSDPKTHQAACASINTRIRALWDTHGPAIRSLRAKLLIASILEGRADIERNVLLVRNRVVPLTKAFKEIEAVPETLAAPIFELIQTYRLCQKHTIQNLQITISDNVTDFERLSLGDTPVMTCLSVRDSKYPISTVALAASSTIRPVVVRDPTGLIVSRALLLAGRDQQGLPVLYLERIYPQDTPPLVVNELLDWAEAKARLLGRKLVLSLDYAGSLQARGLATAAKEAVLIDADPLIPFAFSDSIREQVRGVFVATGYVVS